MDIHSINNSPGIIQISEVCRLARQGLNPPRRCLISFGGWSDWARLGSVRTNQRRKKEKKKKKKQKNRRRREEKEREKEQRKSQKRKTFTGSSFVFSPLLIAKFGVVKRDCFFFEENNLFNVVFFSFIS